MLASFEQEVTIPSPATLAHLKLQAGREPDRGGHLQRRAAAKDATDDQQANPGMFIVSGSL